MDAYMERYGRILKIVPGTEDRYKELHAAVWPEVLEILRKYNIVNYSIYLKEGFLFSYYEYAGDDYEADMAKADKEPVMKKWCELCIPCQSPVASATKEEWWSGMEEVFHMD